MFVKREDVMREVAAPHGRSTVACFNSIKEVVAAKICGVLRGGGGEGEQA